MDAYFFKVPFATSGTTATIPRPTQVDGTVSYTEGFPIDYQLEQGVNPAAKDVPRDKFNELLKDVTGAIQALQIFGFPEFITSANNDGSAYSYSVNATVRFANGWAGASAMNYYSLVDGNTADPTDATKWGLVTYQKYELPGVCKEYMGATLPNGYIWANGTTIGNASSNATGRANVDTLALYTVLWGAYPAATLPIYTSAGALSTRGVSAAADFAANKALATPDKRGLVAAGADNMGGIAAAGKITTAGCGIDGSILGANGGLQNVGLTLNQNATHSHTVTAASSGSHFHPGTTASSGAHVHELRAAYPNYTANGVTFIASSSSGPVDSVSNTSVSGDTKNLSDLFPGRNIDIMASAGAHTHTFNTDIAGTHTHTMSASDSGSGAAHLNVQPTIISNFIIALGTA